MMNTTGELHREGELALAQSWQEHLDAAIETHAPELMAVRRHMHRFPEPSGVEYETTDYLLRLLTRHELATRSGPDGRGLLVDGVPRGEGDLIALRADIDALKIQDVKRTEYCSQVPNVMHACGHDGHTATILGAILGLQALQQSGTAPWPLRWRAIFQPAEETSNGAVDMMAAGALEGVGAILAAHMDPSRVVGRVGLRYGVLTAACDEFAILIEGRGGHAARPHESLDPIAAAAQVISSLYMFVPRATDSHDPVVVTIGQVAAGDNPNVIPESAVLRGTIRSLSKTARERTRNQIAQLARGLGDASGTRIDAQFFPGPQSVTNVETLTDLLKEAAQEFLGRSQIDLIHRPSMGGEDFAFYLDRVPGAMFRLGCASPAVGSAPLHSPSFDLDERAILIGARLLARAAVLWCNPERPVDQLPEAENE